MRWLPLLSVLSLGCAAQAQGRHSRTLPNGVVVESLTRDGEALDPQQYRARWDMNSSSELAESWWRWSGATSAFEEGIATIGGENYEEWMQRTDKNQSLWWDTVEPAKGFRIQTRMRVQEGECGGIGLWIHDGARMLKVFFCEGQVGIGYPFSQYVRVDTREFRTYTIEGRLDWVRIAVDGDVVLERQGPETMRGGGTQTLMFGNLGGATGVGQWDWLSYDTRPLLVHPGQHGPGVSSSELALARLRHSL